MQSLACYLYPILLECQVITEESVTTRYPIVYANRIKLYKFADNKVKLLFKDNDQKSVNFSGYTVEFSIFKNRTSPAQTTAVTIPSGNTAVTSVILTINSILDSFSPGLYNYAITATNSSGNDIVVYSDDNYSIVGEIEVALRQQIAVPPETLTVTGTTSNYVASNSTLHTFQFNYNNFNGTVRLQASLDLQPSSINSWFTFDTLTIVAVTNNVLYNYTAAYKWVRVMVTTTSGSITKILYTS